jgi:ribosomal protein S18 acetylase RimI-like enzyme
MGSIDVSQFRLLTEDRISDCVALSAEAGWNQTSEDWALFLRYGNVLGLRTAHGVTVASAALLPYPDDFAWISMVLVTASRRRQRIGTRILEACCAEVARRGLVAMLDATPAGERIYRPLGFEAIANMSRWQGVIDSGANSPVGVRGMAARDIPHVTAIDATAFGSQRKFLIESLFRRRPRLAFVSEDNTGFALARPGRIATQIGPLVATNESAAAALLNAALGCVRGPVFLDLIDGRAILVRHLRQRGFSVQRPFLRMGFKRRAPFGEPAHMFVAAGPEFG